MNGITVRNIFRCGYSLRSVLPRTSRLLYKSTTDRNHTSCSIRPNQRITLIAPSIGLKAWNVNNSLISLNYRYLSTSLPHNGQTALKPKNPENRGNDKKQKKDTDKATTGNQVEAQPKTDAQTEKTVEKIDAVPEIEEKLSLTAKFKKMWKDYWYVLMPVHFVTSTLWFTGFYYISTSGVDIPAVLESFHFNEAVIAKLRDSSLGHAAIAYLCYKIATPLRYTVTLGGTTLSIKYLSQWGYIRPVPTKAQLKQIYDEQKAKFKPKD